MNNYSVFQERRTSTNVVRNKLTAQNGTVTVEGRRAVDSSTFTVKSPVDVEVGDIITCLIDDVPTDYLTGAWHFYHNSRDESGYNLDLTGNATYVRNTTKSERFYGHVGLNCVSSGTTLTATPTNRENNYNLLDFDTDGEIQIWCKTPSFNSNVTQIIYSRMDSSRGIEVGIKTNSSSMFVFLRVKGSTSSINETTTSENYLQVNPNSEVFIRVHKYDNFYNGSGYAIKRNNNNNSSFGAEYFTGSVNPTSEVIRIGSNYSGGEQFRGIIYSVKTYSQALDDSHESIIYKRKQPYDTMKFGGKVDIVTKGNINTTIECTGFSNEFLLKIPLNKELFDTITSNRSTPTSLVYNNTLLETIVSQIISDMNLTNTVDFPVLFVYDHTGDEDDSPVGTNAWNNTSNVYHMRNIDKFQVSDTLGTIVRALSILGGSEYNSSNQEIHLNGADYYFMTPRRVLIFESSEIDNNTYFEDGLTSIEDGGYDDRFMFNDVTIFSKIVKKTRYVVVGNASLSTQTLNVVPNLYDILSTNTKKFIEIQDVIISNASNPSISSPISMNPKRLGSYFWWDFDFKTGDFYFNNPSTTAYDVTISYTYLDLENDSDALTSLPSTNETKYFYNQIDQSSIDTYGRRSRKYIIPLLEDHTTLAAICRRLLGRHKDPTRKLRVKKSYMVTHLHIGTRCSISKKLNNIYAENHTIQSITYRFPNFSTIVGVGDFEYNFLDELQITGDTINGIVNGTHSGTIKT